MLERPILVAYATKYGTTGEVAKAIGEELEALGLTVDVQQAHQVDTPERYGAYVLGAPLYIGRWHGDIRRFIETNKFLIQQRPTAVFALGPITTEAHEMSGSVQQFNKQINQIEWLEPVAKQVFVGAYNPAKLEGMHRLFTSMAASPLYGVPATDNRDWGAITAWAENLAEVMAVGSIG